jgi:uncharacterized protein YeeX (DUF496 family)
MNLEKKDTYQKVFKFSQMKMRLEKLRGQVAELEKQIKDSEKADPWLKELDSKILSNTPS